MTKLEMLELLGCPEDVRQNVLKKATKKQLQTLLDKYKPKLPDPQAPR